jgi:hypothetical protein
MVRALLPRLGLVVVVTPCIGAALAYAFAHESGEAAATAGSIGAAVAFGAIALAPSTENALRRAVIALFVAVLACGAAWLQRS